MYERKLYNILAGLAVFILWYILSYALFVNQQAIKYPTIFTIAAVAIFSILIFFIIHILDKIKINSLVFLIIMLLLTAGIRLAWVLSVNTQPASDFLLYNQYAINISKGLYKAFDPTYSVFPFKIGFPFVLAGIYKIFGVNIFYIKLFNIALSMGLMLIIYFICKAIYGIRIARISTIIFTLWPAQIMFCSVLASENLFIPLLTLVLLILIKLGGKINDKKAFLLALISGLVLALAHYIRPLSYIIIPAFILHLFFFVKSDKKNLKSIIHKALITFVFVLSFLSAFSILNYYTEKASGLSMWSSSSGYNLLVGTNQDSSGTYNSPDASILDEFGYNREKIHEEAAKRALKRISDSPIGFIMMAEKKLSIQWADEGYGYYWSVADAVDSGSALDFIKSRQKCFALSVQVYHVFILLFSLIGCIYGIKNKKYELSVMITLFLLFIGAHTFLEVQSRYQAAAMPFIIIMAIYGVSCVYDSIKKHKKGIVA